MYEWISWIWLQKIPGGFFVNVFVCNISPWNCCHKHDIYNLIKCLFGRCISDSCFVLKYFYTLDIVLPLISFPHENSCILSFKCDVCGNSFKIKCYIRTHLQQKNTWYFLVSSSRFQHFRRLLQNAKPHEMTNESSSPIPPKKS